MDISQCLFFLNRINSNETIFVDININVINNYTFIYTMHKHGLFLKAPLVTIVSVSVFRR